jgi:cation transport protein ChaC
VSEGPDTRTLWVFGYGSLMWQPGFRYVDARRARLEGYHRSFCIYSLHYRGTQQRPGLVLGLARGGTCEGVAFRVADEDAAQVRAYLHARELIYGVYREASLPANLLGEREPQRVDVLTYIAETGHPSFAGALSMARRAAIIRAARGKAGSNLGYFVATLRKLRELGIRQADLERLAVQAGVGGSYAGASGSKALEGRCRAFAMRRGAPCSPVRNERRHAFSYRRRLPS